MKSMLQITVIVAVSLLASTTFGAENELKGTWSGSWMKEGIPEAVTIELAENEKGGISGKFLTPTNMVFTVATFNAKTNAVALEAVEPQSKKKFRIDAKLTGTELNGTMTVDAAKGNIRLIKWTFFPR